MPTEEEVLKIGKKLEKMIANKTTVSIISFRDLCILRLALNGVGKVVCNPHPRSSNVLGKHT